MGAFIYLGVHHNSATSQLKPLLTRMEMRYNYVNEFGLRTIRHLCPCLRCSLAVPAEILLGKQGNHVSQTLRFLRFIA